jgi:hypothetical protein
VEESQMGAFQLEQMVEVAYLNSCPHLVVATDSLGQALALLELA